ncbi:radical SAM protein [Akkermansia sp.]|uniref:radical SAM/SPASM domain-containing protein n=1 Tax=Akkermansia sp. TaxID=1872421 RepID=UPI0025C1F29A|nr:radical SAM protein [Akkermansia sp.]MCC8147666.1 radical SAM protein [Akkermansia sp.]
MINLTLCLTHDCNLRCGYCYAGRKRPVSMSVETAFRSIDFGLEQARKEGKALGRQPEILIGFFGGEPLLEWDLLRKCRKYAEKEALRSGIRLKWTLTTNMTLLTEERVAWLMEKGFRLGLSLDGNAAMHGVWRKYPDGRNSHGDCAAALEWFKGREHRADLICVVNPLNVRHLADSVRWMGETCGLDIMLNPDFGARWTEEALETLSSAYEEIGREVLRSYQAGRPLTLNVIQSKIAAYVKGGYEACEMCTLGEREIAVAVSGNMYPCARLVGNDDNESLRMGNVWTGEDWKKKMTLSAARGNKNPKCFFCPLRPRCLQWCGCVNYVTSGRTDWVGEFTCFHERLSIRVADDVAETLWEERNPWFIREFYSGTLPAAGGEEEAGAVEEK